MSEPHVVSEGGGPMHHISNEEYAYARSIGGDPITACNRWCSLVRRTTDNWRMVTCKGCLKKRPLAFGGPP